MLRKLGVVGALSVLAFAVFTAVSGDAGAAPATCGGSYSTWTGTRVVQPSAGWCIRSASDGWYTIWQNDSNLVTYDQYNRARWSTNTTYYAPLVMVLQSDGNVVLYHWYGSWYGGPAVWNSGTGGHTLPSASTWHYEAQQALVGRTHESHVWMDANNYFTTYDLGDIAPNITT